MENKRISGVILAGGNSHRMGQNKALLKLRGETLIQRVVSILQPLFEEILIVTNTPKEYSMLENVRFVQDYYQVEKKSALVGLYSGLLAAKNEFIFIVGCDMPLLKSSFIRYMKEKSGNQDILIPHVNGYYEPLHAIYSKRCLPVIKNHLDQKDYRIKSFFSDVNLEIIEEPIIKKFDPDLDSFLNINHYQEYIALKNKYFNSQQNSD